MKTNIAITVEGDSAIGESLPELTEPSSIGKQIVFLDDAKLTLEAYSRPRGLAVGQEILVFSVQFASGVASGLLANWIFSLLQAKKAQVRVNGVAAEITPDALKQALDRASRAADE